MITNPAVIGCKGSMGRRYMAILRYLGLDPLGYDVGDDMPIIKSADGIIIATPTELHDQHIKLYSYFDVPILCEKPLATDIHAVDRLLNWCLAKNVDLQMVNQYREILLGDGDGPTIYDYYNHGRDGIYWDCISILALSRGSILLKETSPLWTCAINGQWLSPEMMDQAYIAMIKKWLSGQLKNGWQYMHNAHHRVAELINADSQ